MIEIVKDGEGSTHIKDHHGRRVYIESSGIDSEELGTQVAKYLNQNPPKSEHIVYTVSQVKVMASDQDEANKLVLESDDSVLGIL